MMILAVFANLILVICEAYTLWHIRHKLDILKYYTYLQNGLSLISSLLFVGFMIFTNEVPEIINGFRYVTTCGLVVTMFIFIFFLGADKKVMMTNDDFLPGISPVVANTVLHYICPLLSLVSFVLFEREFCLSNPIWTGLVALPSCLYWIVYAILSVMKLWDEPYNFTDSGGSKIRGGLPFVLMPVSFIVISYVVWNIRF